MGISSDNERTRRLNVQLGHRQRAYLCLRRNANIRAVSIVTEAANTFPGGRFARADAGPLSSMRAFAPAAAPAPPAGTPCKVHARECGGDAAKQNTRAEADDIAYTSTAACGLAAAAAAPCARARMTTTATACAAEDRMQSARRGARGAQRCMGALRIYAC